MSEVSTDTTTTEAAEVVIADDSRIADADALNDARTRLHAAGKQAAADFKRATKAIRAWADNSVAIRALILLADGKPDWSAKSDAYRLNVAETVADALSTLSADELRRFQAAARQHVKRWALEKHMTAYVLAHVVPDGVREKVSVGEDGIPTGDLPAAFKSAMRAEYKRADLTPPEKYAAGGSSAPTAPEGADADAEPSASAAIKSAIGGLPNVAPLFAVSAIHETLSTLAVALTAKDAKVSDREKVSAMLHRVSAVAFLTAKHLDGKIEEKDADTLREALYDAERDAY